MSILIEKYPLNKFYFISNKFHLIVRFSYILQTLKKSYTCQQKKKRKANVEQNSVSMNRKFDNNSKLSILFFIFWVSREKNP